MPLQELLKRYQSRVEQALEQRLPTADTTPDHLHQAMRYSTLDGGKRIRPILLYATGQALGVPMEQLDGPACAIECIHAYSLVHDDLPAMDDDELRRGKQTCHIAYDEATAILVGDALQSLAFQILSSDTTMTRNSGQRLQMVHELASASGSLGMVGGQAIDIAAMGSSLTVQQLETMHRYKTGALIRASVRIGALASGNVSPTQSEQLNAYAEAIGLAFQIRDDILDVEADIETLGKPQGSDQARDKPTYTSLLGLEGAKQKARELHLRAMESLQDFDERTDPLRWISSYIVDRKN